MAIQNLDLWGEPIKEANSLAEQYNGVCPFTILDARQGTWQARKRKWLSIGIKSEIGRDAKAYSFKDWADKKAEQGLLKGNTSVSDTSIFDPVLCEIMYRWFAPKGGGVLDPFAGGSVRGIVANYLGYRYTGIDIRQEQVDSNREQALNILPIDNQPQWYVGDSNAVLDGDWQSQFDLIFTCPPYADLEVYSDMKADISNMQYDDFIFTFESIMRKACKLLKSGGMAILVVGDVRDKSGNYYGFVADTIKLMQRCKGMSFYNDAILATSTTSAGIRANANMIKGKGKLVKVHQNILMFKKQ